MCVEACCFFPLLKLRMGSMSHLLTGVPFCLGALMCATRRASVPV